MRIMTLGAGAVGGYFAGRLAQSGDDVTDANAAIAANKGRAPSEAFMAE